MSYLSSYDLLFLVILLHVLLAFCLIYRCKLEHIVRKRWRYSDRARRKVTGLYVTARGRSDPHVVDIIPLCLSVFQPSPQQPQQQAQPLFPRPPSQSPAQEILEGKTTAIQPDSFMRKA
jgi:hypothetical protein